MTNFCFYFCLLLKSRSLCIDRDQGWALYAKRKLASGKAESQVKVIAKEICVINRHRGHTAVKTCWEGCTLVHSLLLFHWKWQADSHSLEQALRPDNPGTSPQDHALSGSKSAHRFAGKQPKFVHLAWTFGQLCYENHSIPHIELKVAVPPLRNLLYKEVAIKKHFF